MTDTNGYTVFLFPQALEALGDAIKPWLQDGPAGQHLLCSGIDTGGSFIEMTLPAIDGADQRTTIELMVPSAMVRMIVSTTSDDVFGFRPAPP